ncbi:MAG: hypothetical protein HY331_17635 [Chloroflexi bacterium]|nr:hypothetical protein [Chloroflexota bacterium]
MVRRLVVMPVASDRLAVEISFLSTVVPAGGGSPGREAVLQDAYDLLRVLLTSPYHLETIAVEGWMPRPGGPDTGGPTLVLRGRLDGKAARNIDWNKLNPQQLWSLLEESWILPDLS